MTKNFEEWEEIQEETVVDLTKRLKPDIASLCPPVLIALEILRIPQSGIATVLKTKQPRISLFRQGKRKMKLVEQERLCDLSQALVENCEHDLESLAEPPEIKEVIKTNLECARIMNKIQQAIILKEKEKQHE